MCRITSCDSNVNSGGRQQDMVRLDMDMMSCVGMTGVCNYVLSLKSVSHPTYSVYCSLIEPCHLSICTRLHHNIMRIWLRLFLFLIMQSNFLSIYSLIPSPSTAPYHTIAPKPTKFTNVLTPCKIPNCLFNFCISSL
jgi:hypothetical protein